MPVLKNNLHDDMKVWWILLLFIFGHTSGNIYCQKTDTLIYESFVKRSQQRNIFQDLERYILFPDSTYINQNYQGLLGDSKDNYRNWILTENDGLWYIEKRTLFLIRGDIAGQFKITKKCFKRRRLQRDMDGSLKLIYFNWVFERRDKYKLVRGG
jgi:hypothetical protein